MVQPGGDANLAAVFAPIPSAIVTTATMPNPGMRASPRNPWRRSPNILTLLFSFRQTRHEPPADPPLPVASATRTQDHRPEQRQPCQDGYLQAPAKERFSTPACQRSCPLVGTGCADLERERRVGDVHTAEVMLTQITLHHGTATRSPPWSTRQPRTVPRYSSQQSGPELLCLGWTDETRVGRRGPCRRRGPRAGEQPLGPRLRMGDGRGAGGRQRAARPTRPEGHHGRCCWKRRNRLLPVP